MSEIREPIRVAALVEEPCSFDCFPLYSLWNKTLCPRPGSEIELISIILTGFLNLSIEWIMVDSYSEMEDYVNSGKADFQGISLSLADYGTKFGTQGTKPWFHTPPYTNTHGEIHVKLLDVEDVAQETWLKNPRILLFESFQWNIWVTMAVITLAAVAVKQITKKVRHYTAPAQLTNVWWFIEISALLSILSNIMAIGLVQPSPPVVLPFETVDALAERLSSNTCKLVMVRGYNASAFYSLYQTSDPESKYSKGSFTNYVTQTGVFPQITSLL